MDISEEVNTQAEEPVKVLSGGYMWDFFTPSISSFYADQYSCSICYLVLRDPCKCQNNHLYCKSCIYNWMVSDNRGSLSCPVCRDNGPFEMDLKIKSELDSLCVCCLQDHCCWIGKLSDYYTHVHGHDIIKERHVPDLLKTFNQERVKKSREDGFINEDRIVTMMSVIYADIEQRRRRIENIRQGRTDYSHQQLGDIQLLHDRLLSLRQNIDTFFGQSTGFPLWAQFNQTSRTTENSVSSVSSGISETEMSEGLQTARTANLSEMSLEGATTSFVRDSSPVPSFSSELDFSEDIGMEGTTSHQLDDLVDDLQFEPAESSEIDLGPSESIEMEEVQRVQTNLPRGQSEEFGSNEPGVDFPLLSNRETNHVGTQLPPRTSSTATSRMRYDYLSRRFNFPSLRRESDPTDIKRRKIH